MVFSAPFELAEASFDQVFDSVVRLMERTIPGVHSFLSWEPKDANLGPILHVRVRHYLRNKRIYGEVPTCIALFPQDWPVLLSIKKLQSRALLRPFPAAAAA
jgi:hypothetical protein